VAGEELIEHNPSEFERGNECAGKCVLRSS